MDLIEEFATITKAYDDALFQIFKRVIDTSITKNQENKLDDLTIFINVFETLKESYINLAIATGIISSKEYYNEAHNNLMISENLQERILTYLNPIIENARNFIIKKAQEVCESTTLDELQISYDELFTLLSNKTIQHNSFVYEDLDITKKLIPTK